jgi:hypothetical protein
MSPWRHVAPRGLRTKPHHESVNNLDHRRPSWRRMERLWRHRGRHPSTGTIT